MIDGLIAVLWQLLIALVDRKADEAIGKLPAPVREAVQEVEDRLVEFLSGPAGERIAREIVAPAVKRAVAKKFPNDPTTGTWG